MRTRHGLLGRAVVALATTGLLLAGCGDAKHDDPNVDPTQVDAVQAPPLGACRLLTPHDVAQKSNATRTVDCSKPHTAETYAVGDLPAELQGASYDDPKLGAFAYQTCGPKFQQFLGADDSLVMRTLVTWAWFRPSQKAWDKGARWYRCDVVGGGEQTKAYADLPTTARAMLAGGRPPDRWMVCVDGASVQSTPRIACTKPHNWRAVTTIKVGDPGDAYPGDHAVQIKTKDYCSKSVAAWLGYPVNYDFGYTWFHEGEWKAGNRRSVCWAKTTA